MNNVEADKKRRQSALKNNRIPGFGYDAGDGEWGQPPYDYGDGTNSGGGAMKGDGAGMG